MFGEDVSTSVSSLATNKMIEVREGDNQWSENKGDLFYLVVAKLLFLNEKFQAWFVYDRELIDDHITKEQPWLLRKLRMMLRFVHCTLKEEKSCATNIDGIFTWVDASYVVHNDTKIHSGGGVAMGLGLTHCRSCG